MAFMDMLGQYATNRFNNAVSNLGTQYDNAAQFLTDPQAAMQRRLDEEEEERRRREALAAQARGTPVKQTITTDPVTGEQKMKIEGSVQDLSAANPITPTVTGPAVPGMMDQTAPSQDEMLRDQAMAQLGGIAPVAPAQMPTMAQPQPQPEPEPQPVVTQPPPQPAAVAQPQPQPAPAAMPQPQAAEQPVPPDQTQQAQAIQPRIAFGEPIPEPPTQVAQAGTGTRTDVTAGTTGAVPPTAAAAPAVDYTQRFATIFDKPDDLVQVMANSKDPAEKKIAADLYRRNQEGQLKSEEAADIVQRAAQGDSKAQTQMSRELSSKKDEGSYIKAYLFARLGMNELAQQEQEKLGQGSRVFESVSVDGKNYTVERDKKTGEIKRAYDSNGDRQTSKTVAKLQAEAIRTTGAAEVEAGTYMDPTGQVPGNWVLERRAGGSVYRQVGTNKIATAEQANALRKTGVQGTLGDQRDRLIQKINLELRGRTAEEQMAILRPYNQALAGMGQPPIQPTELNLQSPQIAGGAAAPAQAAPAQAAPAQAAPAQAAPAQAAPAQAAPAQAAPAQAAGAVAPTPPAQARPPAAGGALRGRPTMAQIQAQEVAAKKEAEIGAEDVATLRKNQSQNESKVDTAVDRVSALLDPNREGRAFESSVGATALPGARFIPGSPQASWFKLFDEVKGGQFLAAIKEMKGLGALSDIEGRAATQAISRLSASQNEQDFRRAANDYLDIITRGVDRDRAKLGQPPKYNTPEATKRYEEDTEAMKWLKANPKDPKAKAIERRLRERGYM